MFDQKKSDSLASAICGYLETRSDAPAATEQAPEQAVERVVTREELNAVVAKAAWGKLKNDPNNLDVRRCLEVMGRLPFFHPQ